MAKITIEWVLSRPDRFRYQLLYLLRMDCECYLGKAHGAHLWAGDEKEQIEYMKRLWNSLSEKPKWLTLEQLEEYENRLCPTAISQFSGKYQFLSNFYPCHISYFNLRFTSVEAAFQAAKCQDVKQREQFCGLSPAEARRLGRTVPLRPHWETCKIAIMRDLLVNKFQLNPGLKKLLIATGNAPLIESNAWHDNFWGNCTCKRCENMEGRNVLGNLLMEIRRLYAGGNDSSR